MKRFNYLVILLISLIFFILNTVQAEVRFKNYPIQIKPYPTSIQQKLPPVILKQKPTAIKFKMTGICNNHFCFFQAKFKNANDIAIKVNDFTLNQTNNGSYQGSVPVTPGQEVKIVLTVNGFTKKITMNVPSLNKNLKFNNSTKITNLKTWLADEEEDENNEQLNLSWHQQKKSDYYLFHKKFTDRRKNLITAYHFKTYDNSISLKRNDTLNELNQNQASNLYLWASPVNEHQLTEFAAGSQIRIEGFPSNILSN